MRTLVLPATLLQDLHAHAQDELPNECCGIITTRRTAIRRTSLKPSPYGYRMDTADLTHDTLAIYHSHTTTEAYPSPSDIRLAWPELLYVIVSVRDGDVRAFHIEDGEVVELAVETS